MPPLAVRALPEPLELVPQCCALIPGQRHPPPPTACALSADGRWAAVCVGDEVRVVDVRAVASLRSPGLGHTRWVGGEPGARTSCAAFSPDGAALVVGRCDGAAVVYDAATGARRLLLAHVPREELAELTAAEREGRSDAVYAVAVSAPDREAGEAPERYAATAGADGTLMVWRLRDGAKQRELSGEVRVDPSEVERAENDMITSWLSEDMRRMLRGGASPPGYRCCCFAPDGLALAAAGEWDAVHVWERRDGAKARVGSIRAKTTLPWAGVTMDPGVSLEGHGCWVFAVAWSATPGHDEKQRFNGGCLASLDIHGFLRLWDVPLRACVRWFRARASARTSHLRPDFHASVRDSFDASASASRTRREPSIRPKISRIDFDATERERSPAVDFRAGTSPSARSSR